MLRRGVMKDIKVLALDDGKEPFIDWLKKLDKVFQAKVQVYVDRVAFGGAKNNIKSLGDGVFEIKINYGPGFRVYFGEDGETIILLLLGGDKSGQSRDIKKAKDYWSEYVSQ